MSWDRVQDLYRDPGLARYPWRRIGSRWRRVADTSVENTVPTDGPWNWFVPQTAEHFTALGLDAPDAIYRCDETSGDLVDALGKYPELSPSGTQSYANTLPHWSGRFIGLEAVIGGWISSSIIPLASTDAFAILSIEAHAAPSSGTSRVLKSMGGVAAAFRHDHFNSSGTAWQTRCQDGGSSTLASIPIADAGDQTTVKQILWGRRTSGPNAFRQIIAWNHAAGTGYPNTTGSLYSAESLSYTGSAPSAALHIGSTSGSANRTGRIRVMYVYEGLNASRSLAGWTAYMATLRNGDI